ncbi:MAG: phenylalanine--tRNA ligase subunit alpha, partial [Oribacterium sp.]|nr:phenylalanine--tRNA ligase subunit alpha [Oribacterium sp.]
MENTQLEELKKLAQEHIQNAKDTNALNDIRVKYLGKKGEITTMLKAMKDLSPEERPKFGQMVNAIREQIEIELNQHMTELQEKAKEVRMAAETIDVTLPAKKMAYGHAHPNTRALEEVE